MAEDYDAWKRALNLKELPVAILRGVELNMHTRFDQTTYESYDESVQYPEPSVPCLYVCKCGSAQFVVYMAAEYETRVRCIVCNNDQCIHSG